jgi:hypothetical protein
MAAPTFVQELEVADWSTTTTPKTTASFNVLANDILVAWSTAANDATGLTISGGSLTWELLQDVNVATYSDLRVWKAVVDVDKSMTVSFAATGGAQFGGSVMTWRNAPNIGASIQLTINAGAGQVAAPVWKKNSAICVFIGDGNNGAADGASRAWLSADAGPLTETSYFHLGGTYTIYAGYHANAGDAGVKTVGLSTPSSHFAIVAVEVLGVVDPPPRGVFNVPWVTRHRSEAFQQEGQHPVVVPMSNRLVTARVMTSSFRIAGLSTAAPLFYVLNQAGSAVLVGVRRLTVQMDNTAANAIVASTFGAYMVTSSLPTGGTDCTKHLFDSLETSNANCLARGAASADGTASTITWTIPSTTMAWRQFHMRMQTTATTGAQMLTRDELAIPIICEDEPKVLRAGQALVIACGVSQTTASYSINAMWEEFSIV